MIAKNYVGAKTGRTFFRPEMTEAEIHQARDDYNGFCVYCGEEQFGGVEPDARKYECEACGQPGVYGYEELCLMGVVRLVDESEVGA